MPDCYSKLTMCKQGTQLQSVFGLIDAYIVQEQIFQGIPYKGFSSHITHLISSTPQDRKRSHKCGKPSKRYIHALFNTDGDMGVVFSGVTAM